MARKWQLGRGNQSGQDTVVGAWPLGHASLKRLAWKVRLDRSDWTDREDRRAERPEHATQDISARDLGQDSSDRTDRQDIHYMTALTGEQGEEKHWGTRVLRQAARTWQVGQASWGDSWDRKKRQQDSHGRKDAIGRLEKTGQDSWYRTIKTEQAWQDSHDRTA